MLHELNHRIRNNLAMVASVLELQKRSQKEQGARDAFSSAVAWRGCMSLQMRTVIFFRKKENR
jgi:two-component sensor histidine kinase